MSRKSKAQAAAQVVAAAVTNTIIGTLAVLATVLATVTGPAGAILATVPYGALFRTTSGGHFNKRGGGFIPSIIATAAGDGSIATLQANFRVYAVPAMRAELDYATTTGDTEYFKSKGQWCSWARPLLNGDTLNASATDDALYTAFERTCPTNRANVNGMLTEITLAAKRRNLSPLPVFADVVVTGVIAMYDPTVHTAYASKGYGHAVFTL